ncbi:hypothetical protein Vadar_013560 [Vaccinium darrowii]|uniref:Uncharacterized protein n=1 Tax=Vaccinium darrowii TaxID=229202 RepID=A0ACB7XIF4_9ERIC|nr:hypothetical protein Vadar_013560 [Vaccinium darrowii]
MYGIRPKDGGDDQASTTTPGHLPESNLNVRSSGASEVITIYADNLTDDMDAEWLGQTFSKYGRVIDAFIPRKRSKNFMSKFGFIRFNSVAEAESAISDLNGVIIRDKKLLVKMATYSGVKEYSGKLNYPFSTERFQKGIQGVKDNKQIGVSSSKTTGKSFVEAVVGKVSSNPKEISVNISGNEWLTRSVVAKLKSLSAMESIREAIHCHGVPQIEVKDMGGLRVVVTFPSSELMHSIFYGNLSWLNNCFNSSKFTWVDSLPKKTVNSVDDSIDEANSKRDMDHRDSVDRPNRMRNNSNEVSHVADSFVETSREALAAKNGACGNCGDFSIQMCGSKIDSIEEDEFRGFGNNLTINEVCGSFANGDGPGNRGNLIFGQEPNISVSKGGAQLNLLKDNGSSAVGFRPFNLDKPLGHVSGPGLIISRPSNGLEGGQA